MTNPADTATSTAPALIACLFTDRQSAYRLDARCDPWDIRRDATTWKGGGPFVAHPNCRTWGSLARFSTADRDEQGQAILCLGWAMQWPAIIEHPAHSRLWRWTRQLPGFTHLNLRLSEWGGVTFKPTILALRGVTAKALLNVPEPGNRGSRLFTSFHNNDWRRWGTPPLLAKAIIDDLDTSRSTPSG